MNATTPQLHSEAVIVEAPMSFTGSLKRIRRLGDNLPANGWKYWLGMTGIATLIVLAWAAVLCWYVFFGLLLVPYRIMRRNQRTRKRQALQHRETLALLTEIERREPTEGR
jgi:hypothetical protein